MIPSRLRRELGLTVRPDPRPKCVLLPHKVPRLGLLVGELSFWNSVHESDISATCQKCEISVGSGKAAGLGERRRPSKRPQIVAGIAKESFIEVFSCSIIVLQSRHETYLPLTSCTSNYPTFDGHREGQKSSKKATE